MKKTALLVVAALAFVAGCGNKETKEVEVGSLAATLQAKSGQTVTFVGKAVVKEAGKFAVYGADSTEVVFVTADETLMSAVECGKGVKVTGVVTACTQEAGKYFVTATAIEKAACCKKDGSKKCCKKDSVPCAKDTVSCKKDTAPNADQE